MAEEPIIKLENMEKKKYSITFRTDGKLVEEVNSYMAKKGTEDRSQAIRELIQKGIESDKQP